MTAALRLGTRGSALARWQAEHVRQRLAALGQPAEIVVLTTTGDRRTDVPLASIGGKGLFTQEIEAELLAGRLDLAVHSLKDVPSTVPPGLVLAALLERQDPRDALVASPGLTLATLPQGARLGTSSLRRQAQALALRPDLRILPLRGNVDTRLRRWRAGDYDALLLAAAGLARLRLQADIAEHMNPAEFLPAAGQGVLAIECRAGDAAVLAAVRALDHAPTAAAVAAERALLVRLDCGCQSPVAAFAQFRAGRLHLAALVATPDGAQSIRREANAPADTAEAAAGLGVHVAESLLDAGAAALLAVASA